MPSPFAQSITNNTNGITQASASFPPTGASSNTGFSTSSTAPSSSLSFTFQPGPVGVNNPFENMSNDQFRPPTSSSSSGYQGTIFHIPKQKRAARKSQVDSKSDEQYDKEGREEPKWAHIPKEIEAAYNQQRTGQAGSSVLPQSIAQQSSSIFTQGQQQPNAQQGQQPASSIFTQQPIAQQGQQPASSVFTQNGQNPQQAPAQPQQQSLGDMFTQFSQNYKKPEAQQQQPASNMLAQNQNQSPQKQDGLPSQPNPFTQDNNPFAASIKSFMDSQPPPKPVSELFAHIGQPQQPAPTQTSQPVEPTSPNDCSMMSTSTDNSPQSQPFGFLNQMQSSPTKNTTAPGQGGSLFDRISRPDIQSDAQPTSIFTQNNAPQANTSTSGGKGGLFDRISRPDTQPDAQPTSISTQNNTTQANTSTSGGSGGLFAGVSGPNSESNTAAASIFTQKNTAQANATAPGQGGSLFDRITRPSPESSTQAASSPFDTNATPASGNLFVPQPSGVSNVFTPNVPLTSPIKPPFSIGAQNVVKPSDSTTSSNAAEPAVKNLFGNIKVPPPSHSSDLPKASIFSPVKIPDSRSQPASSPSVAQGSNSNAGKAPEARREYGKPPSAPKAFSDEETRQLITMWRLKALDKFIIQSTRRDIDNGNIAKAADLFLLMNHFKKREQAILAANGGPLPSITGSKRKAAEEQSVDSAQMKKTRFEDSVNSARTTLMNGTGTSQSSSTNKSAVQQFDKINAKRKADEKLEKDPENGKKARVPDQVSYPSLLSAASGSETSSMFKNILENKKQESSGTTANGDRPAPSASPTSPHFSFDAFPPTDTSVKSPTKTVAASFFKIAAPTTSVSKSAASSETSAEAPKAPAFKMPTTSRQADVSTTSTFQMPTTRGQAPADVSTTPVFKVPTSTGQAPTDVSTTPMFKLPATSSQGPSDASETPVFKLPASINQTPSEASKTPAFKVSAASSQTTSDASNASVFKVPKFGTGAPVNFAEAFRKQSEAEEKKKRKAEEFDSEEETEADWERKYAEEQRAKKQKLEETQKTKKIINVGGKFVFANDDKHADAAATPTNPSENEKADVDATPTKRTNSYDSVLNQPKAPLPNGTDIFGTNIFGHLSGSESGAEGSKTGDADADDEDEDDGHDEYDDDDGEDDAEGETDEDDGPTEGPKSSTDQFDTRFLRSASPQRMQAFSKSSEKSSSGGLFDRITRDESGNVVREVPKPDDKPAPQPGSVLSQATSAGASNNPFTAINASTVAKDTPSKVTKKSPFGTLNLPPELKKSLTPAAAASKDGESVIGDHTWKADSPIKFSASASPPSVSVTSPSPTKTPFGGLFGAAKTNTTADTPTKSTFSPFINPTKTPSVGLGFGFTPSNNTTKSLVPPSNNASSATSRATSPGATTGESANESTADAEDENAPKEEQIDLTAGGKGEENEYLLLEIKGKAIVYNTSSKVWETKGVGPLRVLKHRDTGKTRMVMRTDPSGKIILNASLSSQLKYESNAKQHVRIPFANEKGSIEPWVVKVGKDGDAKKLSKIMEENKSN